MLNKAEQMYRQDKQSIQLSKGQSIDEVQKQDSIDAITNKLNMLRNEKLQAIEDKQTEYIERHANNEGNEPKSIKIRYCS